MTLAASAASLQRLYEEGSTSYPRTSEAEMGSDALDALRVFGKESGLVPATPIPIPRSSAARTHEAIHLTPEGFAKVAKVTLSRPAWMLDDDSRVLQAIARHYARAIAPAPRQTPTLTSAEPQWLRDLAWSRPAPKRGVAPQETEPVGPRIYDAQTIAFLALCRAGLGRPSTLVEHATRAAMRDVVGHDGLTQHGRRLLEAVPATLNVAFARRVDDEIERVYRWSRDRDGEREAEIAAIDVLPALLACSLPDMQKAMERALSRSSRKPEDEAKKSKECELEQQMARKVLQGQRLGEENRHRAQLANAESEAGPAAITQRLVEAPLAVGMHVPGLR